MSTVLAQTPSAPAARAADGVKAYRFGPFRFSPRLQTLWHGDRHVRLGSRAIAILTLLVERRGELVTKAELVRIAWPDTFVEEVNLRVHIAAIRRALGDDRDAPNFITNVAGRGYRFIAELQFEGGPSPALAPHPGASGAALPELAPEAGAAGLVDSAALDLLVQRLTTYRLVSVVGAAGAGKGQLARAALLRVAARFPGGVDRIELSVPTGADALAALLAARTASVDGTTGSGRRDRALLLIEGCELAIGAIASAVERLLHADAHLHVLAVSTEVLGAEGESVFHYGGLTPPVAGVAPLNAPAAQVFLRAFGPPATQLSNAETALVGRIVGLLGGNRRAIELAGVGAASLGMPEILRRLEASTATTPPLDALSNWSLEALSPPDAAVLSALSIFEAGFTIDAARRVACDAQLTPMQLSESLRSLLAKSLLTSTMADGAPRLTLLRADRALARERLRASGRYAQVAAAHADLVRELLATAATERRHTGLAAWLESYQPWLPDILAALAHREQHGPVIAHADLALAALPFIACRDAGTEIVAHARRALAALQADAPVDAARGAGLLVSLVSIEQALHGPSDDCIIHLERAARTEAAGTRAAALLGLTWCSMLHNDVVAARDHARYALEACDGLDRDAQLAGKVAFAYAEHLNGNFTAADRSALRLLQQGSQPIIAPGDATCLDQRLFLRMMLARSLWITGTPAQAIEAAADALDFARGLGSLAICTSLAHAVCPVLFWCGEDIAAAREVDRLEQEAERTGAPHWLGWVAAYRMALQALEAKQGRANPVRRPGVELTEVQRQLLATIVGEPLETSVTYASAFVAQTWCTPELIRLEGLRALAGDGAGATDLARTYFLRATDMARRQGALGWELRAAISLAQVARRDEDFATLAATRDRFTEGHATADLVVAQALLRQEVTLRL